MNCKRVALNTLERAQQTCVTVRLLHLLAQGQTDPKENGEHLAASGSTGSSLVFFFPFNSRKSIPKSLRDERRLCRPHRLQEKHFPFLPPFLLLFFSQLPFMTKIFKHRRVERTVIRAALLLPLEPVAENSFSWLLYLAWYSLRCNSQTTKFTL